MADLNQAMAGLVVNDAGLKFTLSNDGKKLLIYKNFVFKQVNNNL